VAKRKQKGEKIEDEGGASGLIKKGRGECLRCDAKVTECVLQAGSSSRSTNPMQDKIGSAAIPHDKQTRQDQTTHVLRARCKLFLIPRLPTHTVRNSDEAVSFTLELLDRIREHVARRRLLRLVVKSQKRVRTLVGNGLVRLLTLIGRRARRVARVKVPESDLLAADSGSLSDEVVIVTVRGTHPGWRCTEDASHGELDFPHFVVNWSVGGFGSVNRRAECV
jgi:hypothetical protein